MYIIDQSKSLIKTAKLNFTEIDYCLTVYGESTKP